MTATERQNTAWFSYLLNDDGSINDAIPFRGESPARRSLDDLDDWKVVAVPFGDRIQDAIAAAAKAKAARLAGQPELPAEIVEGITKAPRKRAAARPPAKTGDDE